MAIKRTAKRRYTRTVYRCAYNYKRGGTVCSNNLEVRQDILDSAILHAMSEAIDERVLERSVQAAIGRIRSEQEKFPDRRIALERELSLIQTRLHHLVEIIANGKSTDSVIESLHKEEARKKVVVQELSSLDAFAQVISLDAKRLSEDLRSRWATFLLSSLATYHRLAKCSESSWMVTSSVNRLEKEERQDIALRQPGHSSRLLTRFKVTNDGGGGQPIQPSLVSLFRFEIQGVALAA